MAKSQAHNQTDAVLEWIHHLQKEPNDEAIQEKIVLTYKKLVESLARKYSQNSMIHEDLVQVGMIGLLGAVRRFDPSVGKSFESFAIPTILGEIKRYIRDQTWSVHVPRRIKELGPRIKRAIDELTREKQKEVTVKEIADYLEVSEEDVLETMEMGRSYRALSVDLKMEADSDGSSMAILDIVGEEDSEFESVDQKILFEKIFPLLTEREQQVIKCVFFENMSQKETGELLGISQMHVSRIQRRSLRKLRESTPFKSSEVEDWIG